MQVRIDPKNAPALKALSVRNHRSVVGETNAAIEAHLAANRDALKCGPKLQPRKK